jgi:hypothetical protein
MRLLQSLLRDTFANLVDQLLERGCLFANSTWLLGIVCAHPDRVDEPAILVTDLPVTDEHVCLASVEIYHYPKFMAEIPINLNGNQVTCQVNDTEPKVSR